MKSRKMVKFFCGFVVLIFLFLYFLEFSGYYEYNLQNKKNLTEVQMAQFEQDIKDGKDIDLNSYLEENTVDYSNSLTRKTSEINIRLNDYLKVFLSNMFNVLGKFVK